MLFSKLWKSKTHSGRKTEIISRNNTFKNKLSEMKHISNLEKKASAFFGGKAEAENLSLYLAGV